MSSESAPEVLGKALLRRFPLFQDLSEDDLAQLYGMSRPLDVSAGSYLLREGEPGEALYLIVDGKLEILKGQGAAEQVLATRGPGEMVGEMALLARAPRSASARAVTRSRLLVIDQAAFQTLLSCSPTAPVAVLGTVLGRLRSTESLLMQQEKLAALGGMAAGLAHELNNPAAAISRGSAQLREGLARYEASAEDLMALGPEERRALAAGALAPPQGTLARNEWEEGVEAWLGARGVEAAWELAPALVAAGWDESGLEGLLGSVPKARSAPLLRHLAAGQSLRDLLDEVQAAAQAVSELVGAVRRYSYLGRGPMQEVDVPESLDTTLLILRHKMKDVAVRRDYAPGLPRIEAQGGALNQVWTNLIDNAVQAMGGRGELVLRAYAREGAVVVEVEDDGPGVPEELATRIFEPFFTTKPVGSGSGLGLHIAYSTVVHQHQGRLEFISRPGATCFRVTLPIRHEESQAEG